MNEENDHFECGSKMKERDSIVKDSQKKERDGEETERGKANTILQRETKTGCFKEIN